MIVLATKSKARRRLLKICKPKAIFTASNIVETGLKQESLVDYLLRVSFLKAFVSHRKNNTTIGADTIIFFNGLIIGKPKDRYDAFRILKMLSGNKHQVFTGVSVLRDNYSYGFVEKATVKVEKLTDKQINQYLDSKEYVSRAGGYAIQGRARHFMDVVEGDKTTVIGLPMKALCKII